MKGRSFLFLITFAFLNYACVIDDRSKRSEEDKFFDIQGLIAVQVLKLDSIRPSLYKSAGVDEKREAKKIIPDSLGWAREFELLLQADINKSNLRGSYFATTSDAKNGILKRFISAEPERTLLDTLSFAFHQNDGHPHSIRAIFSGKNTLYQTRKMIDYQFQEQNGAWLLSEYHTQAGNKW